MTTLIENYAKINRDFDVYVVINNRLYRPQPLETISPRLIELIPRLFYLVHISQFKRSMDVMLMRSQLHDFNVHIMAIPEHQKLNFSLNFTGKEITNLYKLGVETGLNNKAWATLPPSGLPSYWSPLGDTKLDEKPGTKSN